MKKIGQICGAFLLVIFSFFYTEKAVDIVREKDPIMQTIRKNEDKFKEEAIDAVIKDDHIIPGSSGSKVNEKESYKKMKRYGAYNESLLVFEEINPSVSIDDYYDKYVEQGNGVNSNVALVFKVERSSNIDSILSILEENGKKATFFADGLWIENNQTLVQNMTALGHEVEIMNYNGAYEETYFTSALAILQSITGKNRNYCYAEYDKKEVLELCGKIGLHTIIPTIQVKAKPYQEIKKKVSNGSIISMNVNTTTSQELEMVIQYLKQKGYELTNLDNLLSEK